MILLMFVVGLHLLSPMYLRHWTEKAELNGKTIIRHIDDLPFVDSKGKVRVPVQVIGEHGLQEEKLMVRPDHIEGSVPADLKDAIIEIARPTLTLSLYRSGVRRPDSEILEEVKKRDGNQCYVRIILDDMCLEELDAKQSLVREMGTIVHRCRGNVALKLAINLQWDQFKRCSVQRAFDGIGTFSAGAESDLRYCRRGWTTLNRYQNNLIRTKD